MVAAIELINSRPATASGNVRAYVTIRIGGVTIHGAKIVQQEGQRPWLAPPDKQWQGQDGKPRYSPIVEFSDTLRKTVNDAIVAAWEAQASGR